MLENSNLKEIEKKNKVELALPDNKYKNLNEIYQKFNKDLKKTLNKLCVDYIEDTLEEIKASL